jgi:aspartate/methionine/tyrosine aminotransferase
VTYLRDLPYPGVTFVVAEAASRGFKAGDPAWINLGQGAPETGRLPSGPPRIDTVTLDPSDHAYGPVNGNIALRETVADYYNRTYRAGRKPYRAENIAIVQGGRLALNRALAGLGDISLGYQLPDYAAYEALIGWQMPRLTPVPVRPKDFRLTGDDLAGLIYRTGIGAFLMSNPCNPTGVIADGASLAETARVRGCALLVDEFYSHYVYAGDAPVSMASHVDDPATDDVLLFDGLTKNLRYPGWRVSWVAGPVAAINVLDRIGSALDGGPSQVAQRAALTALEPAYVAQETAAVRAEFRRKRDLMVSALRDMGVEVAAPEGTFYAWGRIPGDAMEFFYRALEQQVITVPGQLFDVNPGKQRPGTDYRSWMRFSFGPPYAVVEEGLTRLAKVV